MPTRRDDHARERAVSEHLVGEQGPAGEQGAAVMTADDARHLTDRIKQSLETTWQLALHAWNCRAWVSLGYDSWASYCENEFSSCRLALPRLERDRAISSLAGQGMSSRAVASLTGTSQRTAARVIGEHRAGTEPNAVQSTTAPRPVSGRGARSTGTDGKAYPARRSHRAVVLLRQTRAAALRARGMTQREIALALDVAQATVSADLAEIDQLGRSAGHVISTEELLTLTDAHGRHDVAAIGARLDVAVVGLRDLESLARQPARDVEAALSVILQRVVYADEWLDADQRRRAIEVIVPTLSACLEALAEILRECRTAAHDGDAWPELARRTEALLTVVTAP